MPGYENLHAVAARQHGLVTRRQLEAAGFCPQSIQRMSKAGKLARVRRGVYRLCGVPITWRSTVLAAVLSAGGGAVLSHSSAAALWGLLDHHGLSSIDITRAAPCRQPGITTYRRRLDRRDRTVHDGIPVTAPARTLVDLAAGLDEDHFGRLVDEALRRRLITLPRLSSALDRVPVGPATARTRSVVTRTLALRGAAYDPAADDWELQMDRWFDRSGLQPARRQYRVRVDGRTYKLDRAIPELMIAIEWSGRGTHGTRSQFEYDSDRRSRLQSAGWRVLDFHYRSDPNFIIRTITSVCAEQRRLLGRPEAATG